MLDPRPMMAMKVLIDDRVVHVCLLFDAGWEGRCQGVSHFFHPEITVETGSRDLAFSRELYGENLKMLQKPASMSKKPASMSKQFPKSPR